ncbi:hypothetical protein C5S53_10515 [Methanophagales archaeon]|jgi:hypothetical protein|nr:hypothetical protein C5S53_10515 [Methanophagales archaeon]
MSPTRQFITEIKGIAAGTSEAGVEIPYQELIAGNGIMELLGYLWPEVKGEEPRNKVFTLHLWSLRS